MHKDDKGMMKSLQKRGMLQSGLLSTGELDLVTNQHLDDNTELVDDSRVQADEDPETPLGKTDPPSTTTTSEDTFDYGASSDDYRLRYDKNWKRINQALEARDKPKPKKWSRTIRAKM
jgi:hypothetical protein